MYIIRKYKTNRKMYDTEQSKYVNLSDVEKLIQDNNEVSVVDSEGNDLTGETMLAIIANKKENVENITALENIIRNGFKY